MEDKFKYTAFISYSHADQSVVKWLHRALEHYRVPVKLIGKETPAGKVPGKFKPIFRDRDDLSAAASLTDSIKEALGQSKFLIVVCSPNAAKSIWVEKEIQEFRKLRGQDYILCLIADSDPDNKTPPFPPALFENGKGKKGFEPIAADMRPTGDGKRMAKLKLISGILGVELDTLIQRDTKRRQIQLGIMAATFSVATIVLSVLLFEAIEARKEADLNRQKAEDLVGFMLGDLREKLEPIGSLQLMDTIAVRAFDYYAAIDPEKMTSEGLSRRARVLQMLGETQDLRGNTEGAREAFLQAYQTTGELLDRDPDNPELIFDHSRSLYWLGSNDLRVRNYASAEEFFLKYAESAEKLVSLDPENQAYRAEIGYAYSNLGIVLYSQGKFRQAEEDFEKALEVHVNRAETDLLSLDIQFDLAQAYAWLSDSERELGNFPRAQELRERERKIYSDYLRENPENRSVWGTYAQTHRSLGLLAFHQGNEKQSLGFYDRGIEILRSLTAYDPENTEWKEQLVQVYTDKANSFIARRDYKEANELLNRALQMTGDLLAINPDFPSWIIKNYRVRIALAKTRLNNKGKKDALKMAQDLGAEFYQKFPPEERTTEQQFLSAEILGLLAEAYRENGDKDAARENWASVLRVLKPFEATGGLTVISLLPRAQKQTGG